MSFNIYKRHINRDARFFDRVVAEQFRISGFICHIYKYLGPKDVHDGSDKTKPDYGISTEKDIEDLLLIENVNRKYDNVVYEMWAHATLQDLSFDLGQWGINLGGENPVVHFHYNTMIERLGRKLMPGDIIEFTFMREFDLLDEGGAMGRFYIVTDGDRPVRGYSATWRPHVYRIMTKSLIDSPQFADVIKLIKEENPDLQDISTYSAEMAIMDAINEQADDEVPLTGFDTSHLWVDFNDDGTIFFATHANRTFAGDGIPPNENEVNYGSDFPSGASNGDYFLRVDYNPPILFQYEDGTWRRRAYKWRREWTGFNKTFTDQINNNETVTFEDGEEVSKRQGLRKLLKAKSEFKDGA